MDERIRRLERRYFNGDDSVIDQLYHAGLWPYPLPPMKEALRLTAPDWQRHLRRRDCPFIFPKAPPRGAPGEVWDAFRERRDAIAEQLDNWVVATFGERHPVFLGPKPWCYDDTKRLISEHFNTPSIYDWGNAEGDVVINGITFRMLPRRNPYRKKYARRLRIVCPACAEEIGLQSFRKHAREQHKEPV